MTISVSRLALVAAAATTTLIAAGAALADSPNPFETAALKSKVSTVVVIYAENRSFDNLFGHFPGAHGLNEVLDANGNPTAAYVPQRDRNGAVLATLPQTWGGVTAAGVTPVVTQAQSGGLPNAPFSIESTYAALNGAPSLSTFTVTRDLYHRFFENQMQIGSGSNENFAAWADSGGLTMGHFDYSNSALYKLAQQYTLADEFFEGAFGGSFLNHQYLICACAPEYPHADAPPTGAKPTIAVLDTDSAGHFLPQLTTKSTSPASALDGPPQFVLSGNITPANYFGDNKFYAVNTMQPSYQPSGNRPLVSASGAALLYADPAAATTLPPQTQTNIGDELSAAGIAWKWYAGSWSAATADGTQPATATRSVIYAPSAPRGSPNYQAHHAPFNYYQAFDPVAHAADRSAHLQDYNDLLNDASHGSLPPVVFYKPQGNLNQHEGYANLDDGDAHIASLVKTLQQSPQWPNMVIVITYDEFGGAWDHAAVPMGDKIGPGTRIPAMVISPIARRGYVDHTVYDTASILRLITRRHSLPVLPGLQLRDQALVSHGGQPMGDLTAALQLQVPGPTDLRANHRTGEAALAHLEWQPVADAVSYSVFMGTSPGAETFVPVATVPSRRGDEVSAFVQNLRPGARNYFRVAARMPDGLYSKFSNEVVVIAQPERH